jgi:hypothetical protein
MTATTVWGIGEGGGKAGGELGPPLSLASRALINLLHHDQRLPVASWAPSSCPQSYEIVIAVVQKRSRVTKCLLSSQESRVKPGSFDPNMRKRYL